MIYNCDVFEGLKKIEENSIDMCLTDPPYFLDKLDDKWNEKTISSNTKNQAIKSLPGGMKFDRNQGKKLYDWYFEVSKEIFRVLKPGAIFLSFSAQRLYHRMTCAVEDAGFEIRDSLIWLYTQSQAKSMSLERFIKTLNIEENKKEEIYNLLTYWKTPMLKSSYEPIVYGQKPTNGTFLNNFYNYNVGLLNTSKKVGAGKFPSNVLTVDEISEIIDSTFLVSKPRKDLYNRHKTVKPLALCEALISFFTLENATILDPFAGSGTTLLAAKNLNRKYIGIEISVNYIEIINKRLL